MLAVTHSDDAGVALISNRQGLWGTALGWRGALWTLLLVLLLHLLVLRSVARLLPDMHDSVTGVEAASVFSTRSIRIDNGQRPADAQPPLDKQKAAKSGVANAPGVALTALPSELVSGNTVQFGGEEKSVLPPFLDQGVIPPAQSAASAANPANVAASSGPAAATAQTPPAAATGASAPVAASAAVESLAPTPAYNYLFPPSVRLKYDVSGIVKGFKYYVWGDLSWLHDGSAYTARLEISHFLLGAKVQTSKGAITAQGLAPLRFGEKVRSEVAAHFEREKGKVSFSANTPDVPLLPLAQDQVSVFVQLAAMFAADGTAFLPGSKLVFQTVGARGAEDWEFVVAPPERLQLKGKEWFTYKLVREHRADYDTRAELWLAPALEGMPLRIRLTQSSGDEIDMVWTNSLKP